MIGVELGGAIKNMIAIGAGICDGLGYGDNTKATLMTRGLLEAIRLGVALGAEATTFLGLLRGRRPDRHKREPSVPQLSRRLRAWSGAVALGGAG